LNNLVFSSLLALGAVAAGFLGSLTGLGGGVVLIPLLVLVFGVDIHYAMGASLVSIIATSSGSAAAPLRKQAAASSDASPTIPGAFSALIS